MGNVGKFLIFPWLKDRGGKVEKKVGGKNHHEDACGWMIIFASRCTQGDTILLMRRTCMNLCMSRAEQSRVNTQNMYDSHSARFKKGLFLMICQKRIAC